MPDQQSLFADYENVRHVKSLTENQRKIISLLSCGLQQVDIAGKLNVSKPYICHVIKRLETMNLVKRVKTQRAPEGTRAYNYFYEVAPEAKIPGMRFTPYRVHNIRRKFKILSLSGPVSTDKRTSFSKSKMLRGGPRHVFWYSGKSGYPSVSLEIHPKTMVAYLDKGQQIAAESMEQAQEIGWYALYQARDRFVLEQERFGIAVEIERAGIPITKPHAGLVMSETGPFPPVNPVTPGLWIDRSIEKEMGPGLYELEGHTDHPTLTDAEECLIAARDLKTAMPEAMQEINKKLDPVNSSLVRVEAMLQGGITISQQYEQMVNFMTKALDEMAQIRKENQELKQRLNNKQQF